MHDCGKPFTKSNINQKGEVDTKYHYYNHHNCGSYDIFLYLFKEMLCDGNNTETLTIDDVVEISNLIYYHMSPYRDWKNSEKCKKRDTELLGAEMTKKIIKLHEADLAAH